MFHYGGGAAQIIPNKEGVEPTPSVVGLRKMASALVGQIAEERQAIQIPSEYGIRGQTARRPQDELTRSQADAGLRTLCGIRPEWRRPCEDFGRDYSPAEISSIILQRLRQ